MNFADPIDKDFGSAVSLYTPAALSGIYRYWVADPKNPLTINGQKITGNSSLLVDARTGQYAPGVRNCASPTDANCVASFNIFANDPAHIGVDSAVKKVLGGYPAPNAYNSGLAARRSGLRAVRSTERGVAPGRLARHSRSDRRHLKTVERIESHAVAGSHLLGIPAGLTQVFMGDLRATASYLPNRPEERLAVGPGTTSEAVQLLRAGRVEAARGDVDRNGCAVRLRKAAVCR